VATRADASHLRALPGGADLEDALAEAEGGHEAAPAPGPAAMTLAEAEAPSMLEEPVEKPVEEPVEEPADQAVVARRTPPALANTAALPSLRVGIYELVPALREDLLARQIAWTGWSALTLAVTGALGLFAAAPAVALALPLGIGAWAAHPRRLLRGPAVVAATVGAAMLAGLLADTGMGSLLVAGSQILAAGAVAGLGATFLDEAPADRWRRLHGSLGGAAGAGIGWWAAVTLVGPMTTSPLGQAATGAILGLVASQALVAAALSYRATDRIPSPARIKASLAETYRPPCLRAWQLDQVFARSAPDPETRDGLLEVAAWIYRLQWTQQALEQEIVALEGEGLEQRRDQLLERAIQTRDEFTRERLQATARHLAQLASHRDSLLLERGRTAALAEYASAYLEEARAGLALARVQPGEVVPDRLGDVLGRLRSHAQAGDARRRTAREVEALA